MKLNVLFVIYLLSYSCHALYYQLPFDNHQLKSTLKLKTIYHHASANGPIPGLFRKLEIADQEVAVNQQQDTAYGVSGHFAAISRPNYNDIDLLRSMRDQGRLARWSEPITYFESAIELVPDVTDRKTVTALAMMTNNAYLDIHLNDTEWYDLGTPWQLNASFGWQSDGLRGHIYATDDNSLVVVSIKGTSAGLWTGGPTGEKDKINDNLLFSCCCARISRAWTPVCDCYKDNEYQCESSCLQKKIQRSEFYYDSALNIIDDIQKKYNASTLWITGHSLGGAVASMVGQTFGIPTVTFEIPGDRLPSTRLHLPVGKGMDLPVWHFGHTADPIFIGVCTGPASSCWYGGYAMESRCHTGKVCIWDTVKDKNWRVDIRSHRVRDVIEGILSKPEDFPMPKCVPETDCADCSLWQYHDDRDDKERKSTSTLSSTTTTHTQQPPTDPWSP